MRVVSFLICTLASSILSQINTIYIEPVQTEPNYSADQDQHMVVRNTEFNNGKLFLYIGGTGTETEDYIRISEFAGSLGFDVINVSYPNSVAAASLKNSSDVSVFENYRQEICYGTSLNSAMSVDSLNSINTRVVNLMHHLEVTYPSQNWSQYLDVSGFLNWSKIVAGGHSQGAGHSCYFAKHESPERVLMFSGPNDYSDFFSQPAGWLGELGSTPTNRYYAYLSLLDEAVDFSKQFSIITDLGIYPATDTVHVDVTDSPYNNSHCLYTTQFPGFAIFNHNSPIRLSALNNSVWEYMLTSEIVTETNEIEDPNSFSIFPNPTSTQLNADFHSDVIGKTVYITDVSGQVIKAEKVTSLSISLNVVNLVSGIYFICIENQKIAFVKE